MVVSEVMDDSVGVHVDGLVQERGGKHIVVFGQKRLCGGYSQQGKV
jgi:hypothetical protein